MSEQNQNGAEAVAVAVTEPPKKRGGRRKSTEGATTRRKPAKAAHFAPSGQAVVLTPAQVCNLWRAVMGGELAIERDAAGAVVCRVSFESFEKALPVLLDKLQ